MNNELIKIDNVDILCKEYKGERVVTFRDIDTVHERPNGTAGRNFRENKKHFIEGEDYFKVCSDEIRRNNIMDISDKAHQDIVLLTESGYLMLVKSFTDDLAWDVQRKLVKGYFRVEKLQLQIKPVKRIGKSKTKIALYAGEKSHILMVGDELYELEVDEFNELNLLVPEMAFMEVSQISRVVMAYLSVHKDSVSKLSKQWDMECNE